MKYAYAAVDFLKFRNWSSIQAVLAKYSFWGSLQNNEKIKF